MITLHEYNGLNEKLMHDLRTLVAECRAADGFEPMIYWEVLKLKREVAGDYLLYEQNKLIGYLSTFYFEDYVIELSFAIHPDYRNQSLFEDLLDYARTHLQNLQHDSLLLSTDINDPYLPKAFNRLGAKAVHREYTLMRHHNEPEDIYALEPIELIHAQRKEDAVLLAEIHHRCFNSDLNAMVDRFSQTIHMKNRRCFLVMHKDKAIGALHARFDSDDTTCLHDIGILPEKQGLGFGTQLFKLAINALLAEKRLNFKLIVATNNQKALRLYQRCRFQIQQTYQFWRIDKKFNFPPHFTIPEKRRH